MKNAIIEKTYNAGNTNPKGAIKLGIKKKLYFERSDKENKIRKIPKVTLVKNEVNL